MKVINTYIVNYSKSFAENYLAILFECENKIYYIKYDAEEFEQFKQIDTKIALSLIK
tara:strand:+ start:3894 stop:4064 length:171 start_codon:yes stop_codon:yes gene_type:complete